MPDNKPKRMWLYHPEKGAKIFTFEDEADIDDLEQEGWLDSPAEFKHTEESSDEGGAELTAEQQGLLSAFQENPDSLNKNGYVELGKGFGLKLMKAWKEETLISKIQEKLNGND